VAALPSGLTQALQAYRAKWMQHVSEK